MNFQYELSTVKACTSILIKDNNNKILHGRNMDFGLQEYFSKLVATVHFQRNATTIFTGDVVIGSVFVLTGTKNNKFSITEDTRFNDESFFESTLINILFKNYMSPQWLIRKVLEEEETWEHATQRLRQTKITSPIYFIVGGVENNQGAVIERKSAGIHKYYQLSDEIWFLVQTNYDRDQPDPQNDYRRVPAENKIQNIGQGITSQQLYDNVLSQFTNLNQDTILTMNTNVGLGQMNTTVWYGAN